MNNKGNSSNADKGEQDLLDEFYNGFGATREELLNWVLSIALTLLKAEDNIDVESLPKKDEVLNKMKSAIGHEIIDEVFITEEEDRIRILRKAVSAGRLAALN